MARLSFARQIAMGVTLAAGALVVSDSAVEAQQGRMRVLVPNFEVENNPRSRTGERIGNDVKRQINQMARISRSVTGRCVTRCVAST
jgi:hypothetical protein